MTPIATAAAKSLFQDDASWGSVGAQEAGASAAAAARFAAMMESQFDFGEEDRCSASGASEGKVSQKCSAGGTAELPLDVGEEDAARDDMVLGTGHAQLLSLSLVVTLFH